ncbi:hypothetical protein AA16373_2111 [Komagataeibacter swingsii DSM 16373]|nr:hypothetical protein AA16373_2111 [Komagataeibacter swingsii DSM 16373]
MHARDCLLRRATMGTAASHIAPGMKYCKGINPLLKECFRFQRQAGLLAFGQQVKAYGPAIEFF